MIRLVTSYRSPRLEYIAEILFRILLGTEYEIVAGAVGEEEVAHIYYGSESEAADLFSVPEEGLLQKDELKVLDVKIGGKSLPFLYFSENMWEGYSLPFDIFSASFYLITEYTRYQQEAFDEHGRYIDDDSLIYKEKLHRRPLLHEYAELLWQELKQKFPFLQRRKRQFAYEITFDVDAPFLFKHRPFWLNAGGFIKDVLKTDFASAKKRMEVLAGKADPFDTFQYVISSLTNKEASFFFLLERKSRHDDRFTFRNRAYASLIKELGASGYPIGIHPSYTSFLNQEQIAFEKGKLEEISSRKITRARMHFLKYRLPQTYRYLIRSGITDDYTSCMVLEAGFRHFIALPFPWFDLSNNCRTELMLHPTVIMDRSLQAYSGQGPEEALATIKDYIALTARYKGCFTLLLHNSTLSEWKEWRGWRNVFEETMKRLRQITQNESGISA